jgi:hypothetical protein
MPDISTVIVRPWLLMARRHYVNPAHRATTPNGCCGRWEFL